MSTSTLYHNYKIRGYHTIKTLFNNGTTTYVIEKTKKHICSNCGSSNVTLDNPNNRKIQILPTGERKVYVTLDVYRCNCADCGKRKTERINFLSHKKARISKSLERYLISLTQHMTISSISEIYGIDWRIIKNCEKSHLEKKYKHIKLKNVKAIGIDEFYTSPTRKEYITIIRDLDSGCVLYIGNGKGKDALTDFNKKLRASKHKIKIIAMDMSGPFKSWAEEVLPNATIVFDHFHIIKLMNEKVNAVRISTMKELNEDQKADLKGTKYLWLIGEEKLKKTGLVKLEALRETFSDLGEISSMKEYLRGIYKNVDDAFTAEGALIEWCSMAESSNIGPLKKMAKTIRNHMNGIVAFWSTCGITNAPMEGFNCKIRCLIKQAYGFHDMQYFHLKIYDLPKKKIKLII